MGPVGFGETLNATEVPGIAMAVCPLVLLTRFAGVNRP